MSKKIDIQAEISRLQNKLVQLEKAGDDIYPVGTIITCMVKDYGQTREPYYATFTKQGNERWNASPDSYDGTYDWDTVVEYLYGYENMEINNIRVILPTEGKPL